MKITKEKKGISHLPLIIIGLVLVLAVVFYFFSGDLRNLSFVLFGLSTLAGIFYIMLYFSSKKIKLRKSLEQLEKVLKKESINRLKFFYKEAYGFYLHVSEKNKQNFYGRLTKAREKIEDYLVTQKKLETLLRDAGAGTIKQQEAEFAEINSLFTNLPQKEQDVYFSAINLIKEKLETG